LIWSDLSQLAGAIFLIIGAVLPVVNPMGNAPMFLRMTPGSDEATRAFHANSFKRTVIQLLATVIGAGAVC
jgi:small neutral amino acid transporter SnatA (MarC family)